MKSSRFILLSLLHIFSVGSLCIHAQTTIGSDIEPNKGTLLDLKERQPAAGDVDQTTSNRGLAMPRVQLTSLTQLKPVYSYDGAANTPTQTEKEQHIGLIVYNPVEDLCPATPIVKGLYIWNGEAWQILSSGYSAEVQIFKDQQGMDFKARTFGAAGTWMIENLNVKTFANGTPIDIYDGSATSPAVKSMYAYPSVLPAGWASQPTEWSRRQGLLYNWRAATNNSNPVTTTQVQVAGMIPGATEVEVIFENPAGAKNGKIQGICPTGWHLPSDREWNVLEKELYDNAAQYSSYTAAEIATFNPLNWQAIWETTGGFRPTTVPPAAHGAVMKSVCPPMGLAHASGGKSLPVSKGGFDALLVGTVGISSTATYYGSRTHFWASSGVGTTTSWHRYVDVGVATVGKSAGSAFLLFSVRCKKS